MALLQQMQGGGDRKLTQTDLKNISTSNDKGVLTRNMAPSKPERQLGVNYNRNTNRKRIDLSKFSMPANLY